MYKYILFACFLFSFRPAFADNNIKLMDTNVQLDFRTMHIWRGIATSYTPTFEPAFEVTRNNTTTGIWFAQSIDGNYTELDLYFSYNFRNFTFTLYDYYCPPSIETSHEITNYDRNTTKHTIEMNLAFNGTEQLPLNVLVATMVYGDDINTENNKNYYSTYVELGYSTEIENNTLDLFLGFNMFESYYGDQFGIVNAGLTASRNLKLNETFEIPVQASIITNPMANSLFLNFGFTL